MWTLPSLLGSALPCRAAACRSCSHPLLSSAIVTTKPYHYAFSPTIPQDIVTRAICLSANATKKKESAKVPTHYIDVELGDDHHDVGFDDFDEEGQEEEKDVDDGELLPFDKMRRWLKEKPQGFGEGKTYDTSLEDRLLEEIEQSRKAQEANLNNLKLNRSKSDSAKQPLKLQQQKEGTTRIRIGNLPKKKNIHRDLQSAFKGFPGLLQISPAVTGNKKTRDPICKGFAFLDFDSDTAVNRFVEMYSGQNVPFGKIEKQISSDGLRSNNAPKSGFASAQSKIRYSPQLKVIDMDAGTIDIRSLPMVPSYRSDSDEPAGTKLTNPAENSDETTNSESCDRDLVVSIQHSESSISGTREKMDSSNVSAPRKQKKMQADKKQEKGPKLEKGMKSLKVLGSANRLKIRERAVLTDVFSKYGANVR